MNFDSGSRMATASKPVYFLVTGFDSLGKRVLIQQINSLGGLVVEDIVSQISFRAGTCTEVFAFKCAYM